MEEEELIVLDANTLYNNLLDIIYEKIENKGHIVLEDKTIKIIKPDILIDKPRKKTIWKNFKLNYTFIKRTDLQLIKFIEEELKTSSSVNQKNELLIKGIYSSSIIENIFKKYIKAYVKCSTCNSLSTDILKNNLHHLYYIKCNKCLCEKTIQK